MVDGTEGEIHPSPRTHEILMTFLALTATLFAVSIVTYGIASGRVGFSGTIDVGLISSVVTVTALMAILRSVFGKGNVA